jgi:hypothetical protein
MWGRFRSVGAILMLICMVTWIVVSVAFPVAAIRLRMTEPEVEAALGKPDMRTQPGKAGVGVYPATSRWLVGRHDLYIVTFGEDGRVAQFELLENDFGNSRWTHHEEGKE